MPEIELDTLYGINKQLYAKINPSPEKIDEQLKEVTLDSCDEYYMLLCRERNDYTIFHVHPDLHFRNQQTQQELKEVLESRGAIIDIVNTKNPNTYECWIKDPDGIFLYMFFPCQDWVVYVE